MSSCSVIGHNWALRSRKYAPGECYWQCTRCLQRFEFIYQEVNFGFGDIVEYSKPGRWEDGTKI